MPKQPRRNNVNRLYEGESFEERTLNTLEAQDRLLERLETKLQSPIMNGGFDDLVRRVEKIDHVAEKLRESHELSGKKIDAIHNVVMDPETGLYHRVKSNSKWIESASKGLKWLGGVLLAGGLTCVGKLLYDLIQNHIHFSP